MSAIASGESDTALTPIIQTDAPLLQSIAYSLNYSNSIPVWNCIIFPLPRRFVKLLAVSEGPM